MASGKPGAVHTIDVSAVAGQATVTGGAGADSITLQTAGAGTATLVYEARTDSTYTNFDDIANFNSGEDTIDLTAFTFAGDTDEVTTGTTTNTTFAQFASGVDDFYGDNAVAFWQDTSGADDYTYVFVDVDGDGNFNVAGDMVIQLAGQVTLDADDFAFA